MWAVSRTLYCSDGASIHEFLSLDSENRVFWTAWMNEVTCFNAYSEALKYAEALNFCYGYKLCKVTPGPDWSPDVDPSDYG